MASVDSNISVFVDSMLAIAGAERAFVLMVEKGKLRFRLGRDKSGKTIPMDAERVNRSIIRKAMAKKSVTRAGNGRAVLSACMPVVGGAGKALGAIYLDSRAPMAALDGRSLGVLDNLSKEIAQVVEGPASATAAAADADMVGLLAPFLHPPPHKPGSLEIGLADLSLALFKGTLAFVMMLHHGEFSFACGRNRKGDDVPEVEFLEVRQLAMQSLAEMETRSDSVTFPAPYGTLVSVCCPMVVDEELVGLLGLSRVHAFEPEQEAKLKRLVELGGRLLVGPGESRPSATEDSEAALERDREIAVELRENLTSPPPVLRGIDLYCETRYADGCGGDAHGYEPDPKNPQVQVAWLAEASRGGYMGAVDLTTVRSLLRSSLRHPEVKTLEQALTHINDMMLEDPKGSASTALAVIALDPSERTLTFASAGVPSVWRFTPGEGAQPLLEAGELGPVGEGPLGEPKSFRETLQPDELWVFTLAGVVATTDENDEAFGYDRLQEVIAEVAQLSAEDIAQQIFKRLEEFHGHRPLPFDATVCVIRQAL